MKALIDKWGSRKLAVTAIAGAGVVVAGLDLLTWPIFTCHTQSTGQRAIGYIELVLSR